MQQFSFCPLARLLAVATVLFCLTLRPLIAQRTDSLMVRADAISAYYNKVILNGVLYYLADDGKTGYELWRTDGTPAGTRLVKDIRPGKASAFVSDTSYYTGVYNNTTYQYDYDLTTVRNYLRYVTPYVLGNQLYFWADDGTNGIELWRSNGTEAGTVRVTDILAGPFDSAQQNDILFAGYSGRFSVSAKGKLLFWTSAIQNTYFETDGTAGGTRGIDIQSTKYINSSINSLAATGGKLFSNTSFYQKGKSYYTLRQEADSLTPAVTLMNSTLGYPSIINVDARGPLWMTTNSSDAKTLSVALYRRDSSRAKLIRQFDITRPTVASTRYQYVQQLGKLGSQYLLRVEDTPYYNQNGKGTTDLWQLDPKTDSLRLLKRYTSEQTYTASQTRYAKGSEYFIMTLQLPAGQLFVQGTADTTGTAYRYTISSYDALTNKFQVLEDSIGTYQYQQLSSANQAIFVTRKGPKDPFRVWRTDGKTRTILQTLGVSDGIIVSNVPTVGITAAQYTGNYNVKKQLTSYKIDVWRLDTIAANIGRIGKLANGTWIGSQIGSNGVLYGLNNGSYLQRVTATSPTDSIRAVADIYNGSAMMASENYFGVLNGKILAKPATNSPLLLAIDPAAKPRKCAVALTSKTRNGNPYSFIKDLAYCPAKDSVVTLKRATQNLLSYNSGEISNIYFNTLQWLRDSTTVLLSGGVSLDSLQLRKPQQGQYALSLRGIADGCQATDTYKLYFSTPTVSLIPSLKTADRKGLTALATGGYSNGVWYPATWSRANTDGSVTAVAGSGDVSINGGTTGYMDEFVSPKYEPRYGVYNVQITDALSCSANTSFTYSDKTTLLTVTSGLGTLRNGATICDQSLVSYSATAGGGKTPYTYRWLSGNLPIATGSSGSFTAIAPATNGTGVGYYMVEATDADGNKMLSAQQLLFFAALPITALTSTSTTASVTRPATLSVTVSNYSFPNFRWAKDGQVITGIAGKSLSATSGGVYSVTVGSGTTENCQRTTSLALVTGSGRVATTVEPTPIPVFTAGIGGGTPDPLSPQRVIAPAVLPEPVGRGSMTLMPNPAQNVTRLQLDLPRPAGVSGTLLDLTGKVLHTWKDDQPFEQYTTDVNLSTQPAGVYLLRIEAGGQTYTKRIVKE